MVGQLEYDFEVAADADEPIRHDPAFGIAATVMGRQLGNAGARRRVLGSSLGRSYGTHAAALASKLPQQACHRYCYGGNHRILHQDAAAAPSGWFKLPNQVATPLKLRI
jgi:hypothetical protein